ncbi:MAG TPA: hypothetical protein VGR73_19425 [Bryobacteraceae bacterium]|nr:hypothetical protein [Bryobacteraceae bacterium]
MLRTLDRPRLEAHAAHVDGLIIRLQKANDPQRDLLLEHLTTARAYLAGSMPQEYETNLCLAGEAAKTLSDKALRSEVNHAISELLASMVHSAVAPGVLRHHAHESHRPPTSGEPDLSTFFQGSDHQFGIFYPKKHVVAVFRSFEAAVAARQRLSDAGFADHEVLAVSGEEVSRFLSHLRADAGLWGELMTAVSRFLDTEASLVDRYAGWAQHGAGFLLVYSPTETEALGTTELLQQLEPLAAQWYAAGYICHLV